MINVTWPSEGIWREWGEPHEEVMFQLSFEDLVGFNWEERVGPNTPGRRSDMSAGIMLGRAQCVYMIAVVSFQGLATVVGKGRSWGLERRAWGRPFLATLRVCFKWS